VEVLVIMQFKDDIIPSNFQNAEDQDATKIILPLLLCERETCPLCLKDECKFQFFVNKVLRKMQDLRKIK